MNLPIDTKSSSIVLTPGYQSLNFNPNKDVSVSIDYCFFPSTSALGGGFCIFFIGDTQAQIVSGAPGPGLGYTTVSDYSYNGISTFPGVSGSYIGVGFDVDGWFSLSGTNITGGYGDIKPNSICIRGGENNNYNLLGNSDNLLNYPNFTYPDTESLSLSCNPGEYKTIRVSLLNFSNTVQIDFKNSRGEFITYYKQNLNIPTPQLNVRAGLSYSTGISGNNNFWIKGINFSGTEGDITSSTTIPITSTILNQIDNNLYITLSEANAALSTYGFLNAYLYFIIDPNTYQFTSEYYTNTAEGITNFTTNENTLSALLTVSGGTFLDYSEGYFNYTRFYSATATELISEFDTIVFNLSGIADYTFNIVKITLDQYGDGSVLISNVADFYLTYDNHSALDILDETNDFASPKFKPLSAKYQTLSTQFTTTYTPVLSVFRDNGVIDIIDIQLTVAKKSFNEITQDFRIIDIYQFNDKVIAKLQNPSNNQIYFTSLSAG